MISWYIESSFTASAHHPEELLSTTDARDEGVDLLHRVVHVEARADGRLHAERAVQRPGAVVPDAHGDAGVVEHLRGVVGVDAVDREGHRAAAGLGGPRPDDRDARQVLQ